MRVFLKVFSLNYSSWIGNPGPATLSSDAPDKFGEREDVSGTMETIELLRSEAARVNALELADRRDYHAHLESRGDHSETLEEHIDKYASLARLGPPATEDELTRLQSICPVPLPAELLAFYRTAGAFDGGRRLQDAMIHAPADLLSASARPPRAMGCPAINGPGAHGAVGLGQ